MNDQQRAVMQMALEALCNAVKPKHGFYYSLTEVPIDCAYKYQQAITALREALAQPQGKPVAWLELHNGKPNDLAFESFDLEHELPEWEVVPLYTTPPSVEAAIEATKEKAAKVCEECFAEYANNRGLMLVADKCAAAIRSMK